MHPEITVACIAWNIVLALVDLFFLLWFKRHWPSLRISLWALAFLIAALLIMAGNLWFATLLPFGF